MNTTCRGWGLVSRTTSLTDAERHAGQAHLALCRRCREGLASVHRNRAQVLGGSAGVAAGLATTSLASGSAAVAGATAGGALATKAGAGLVAAMAGAVLATGGAAAVAQQPRHEAGWGPAPVSGSPSTPVRSCSGCTPAPVPAVAGPVQHSVSVPVAVPPVPLPSDVTTAVETTVPPLPLPTLPIPLPSLPDVPLPEPLASVLDPLLDPLLDPP